MIDPNSLDGDSECMSFSCSFQDPNGTLPRNVPAGMTGIFRPLMFAEDNAFKTIRVLGLLRVLYNPFERGGPRSLVVSKPKKPPKLSPTPLPPPPSHRHLHTSLQPSRGTASRASTRRLAPASSQTIGGGSRSGPPHRPNAGFPTRTPITWESVLSKLLNFG